MHHLLILKKTWYRLFLKNIRKVFLYLQKLIKAKKKALDYNLVNFRYKIQMEISRMEVMINKKITSQVKLKSKIQIYNPIFNKILRCNRSKEYSLIIKMSQMIMNNYQIYWQIKYSFHPLSRHLLITNTRLKHYQALLYKSRFQ